MKVPASDVRLGDVLPAHREIPDREVVDYPFTHHGRTHLHLRSERHGVRVTRYSTFAADRMLEVRRDA